MAEAAAGDIEAAQRVHDADAALYEPAVGGGINAQGRQGHDDLGRGLGGGIGAGDLAEGAVGVLHTGQEGQGRVHSRLHLGVFIVGSQGLDGHGGHVHIGDLGGGDDRPAAVLPLGIQDGADQLLPGHVAGDGIVMAVQCQQGPRGTVDALLGDEAHGIQAVQQVPPGHMGHVLTHSRQGQDQAGVLGGAGAVQAAVLVHGLAHILLHGGVVVVSAGDVPAGTGQAQHRPLAADGAGDGGTLGGDIVAGGLIDVLGVQLRQPGLGGQEHVIVAHALLELLGQGVVSGPGGLHGGAGGGGHRLADGVDEGLHVGHGLVLKLRQPGLGGHQHIIIADLLLALLAQGIVGGPGGLDGLLGVQGHLADGGDLLLHIVDVPAGQRQHQLRQTGQDCGGGGAVLAVHAGAVGHAAVGGNAAKAAHPDGAGQVIAVAFGGLGDGDAQQLTDRIAAEVILAEGGAGVGLILVALGIQVHQGEIEVVNAGDLLLGAYQVVELDLYGLAGNQLRILGQDVAVGVDDVIADAPGGDDLVGGHAVLLDAENVAAGGQARNGDLAVFIHGNALAGEAVEGHLIGDGGAGHGNGAALLGSEAVAGALGTHIEQDVVLGVQILLLVLGDVHGRTVDEGVGLDRGAISAHGHHEHAGELRPDGAEVLAAHTLNEGHGVIGHLDDGGARAVGGHGGQAGVVGIGGDGHHVAVAAVQAQHPIVRVGQGDLAVHEALDGLPVTQHVQLVGLAGIHVQVALAVDVQVDVAQVIHILVEAVDGGGGDIVIQVQVVPGHSQLLAAGEFAEGPVGDAVGILGPQELLTAGLRQAEGGGHGVALGLLGNGLQEGIAM